MAVPIGISVGDLIATIKLLKDIGKALDQHGGAPAHYQKTIRGLDTIQAVLSQLETFASRSSDVTRKNAIRGLSQNVGHEVETFRKGIRQYEEALGPNAPTGSRHSPIAKIKWSRDVSSRAAELIKVVETQIGHLQILLDLDISETTSASLSLHTEASANLRLLPTRDELQNLKAAVAHDILSSNDKVASRVDEAKDKILHRVGRIEATIAALSSSTQSATARELNSDLDAQLRQRQLPNAVPATTQLTLTMAIPRLDISTRHIAVLFRSLLCEVELVLRLASAWLSLLLRDLTRVLPQMLLFVRVMHRLPRAISLVLHDNITFEDALGRFHSLQYQQFRHWPVFESSLRCIFADLPGMEKISKGLFVLNPENAPEVSLNASNFAKHVEPGFAFRMSMIMRTLTLELQKCPRNCDGKVDRVSHVESRCQSCGLQYSFETIKRMRPMRVHDRHLQPAASSSDLPNANCSIESSQGASFGDSTQDTEDRDQEDKEKGAGEEEDDVEEFSGDAEELQFFKRIHIENIERVEDAGEEREDQEASPFEQIYTENIERAENASEESNQSPHDEEAGNVTPVSKLIGRSKDGRFKCPSCQKSYRTLPDAMRHYNTIHNQIRARCPTCRKSFSRPKYLERHIQKAHHAGKGIRYYSSDPGGRSDTIPD